MKEIKAFFQEAGFGLTGYFAAIQFNFIEEAAHWFLGIVTAVSCYAAVHYFKKLVKWFDKKVLKIEDENISKGN